MLIKNLVLSKGSSSRRLLHEFPQKCWNKNGLEVLCYVDDLKPHLSWLSPSRASSTILPLISGSQGWGHAFVNFEQYWLVEITVGLLMGFYRSMHFSAKRGLAIACRLSVCLSVRLSVTLVNCDHIGWNSSEIISPLVSLGRSLFATQTSRIYSKGNT